MLYYQLCCGQKLEKTLSLSILGFQCLVSFNLYICVVFCLGSKMYLVQETQSRSMFMHFPLINLIKDIIGVHGDQVVKSVQQVKEEDTRFNV